MGLAGPDWAFLSLWCVGGVVGVVGGRWGFVFFDFFFHNYCFIWK